MKLYFAPMEGITPYTYRNTHAELFGGCDKYFAPFIVPSEYERITKRTVRDILKENNTAEIVPQVLCNKKEAFMNFTRTLRGIGYEEVNINFGCPSGTVVKKGRGSGALKDTEALDGFLRDIFEEADLEISVKTRTGFYSHSEFEELMKIYNKHPIAELTVHPRIREEYYKGVPNTGAFDTAYENSKLPLCYNGDIWSAEDFRRLTGKYPKLNAVMIGRGAIKNPAIFREIRGGAPLKTEELIRFSNLLEERYLKVLGCELYTIHRLKEMWIYAMMNFPEEKKILKAVKKSNKLPDLNSAISCLPEL